MSDLRTAVFLARPGHWIKNLLMLPGFGLAIQFTQSQFINFLWPALIGLCSLCLITSANYVINEWIDAPSDRFHPTKKHRPLAAGTFTPTFIYGEYAILSVSGLTLAAWVSPNYLLWSFLLLVLGIFYNVRPIRTKDLPYIDVLSEALDNPVRLVLGWILIAQKIELPLTILLAYWMASAFQGTVKRLGELRSIGNSEVAKAYRGSFRSYTEKNLTLLSLLYGGIAGLFFVIFTILHRFEYFVLVPFFAVLCGWFLIIGLKENSAAQDIGELYRREKLFTAYVLIGLAMFIILTFTDLPWLRRV